MSLFSAYLRRRTLLRKSSPPISDTRVRVRMFWWRPGGGGNPDNCIAPGGEGRSTEDSFSRMVGCADAACLDSDRNGLFLRRQSALVLKRLARGGRRGPESQQLELMQGMV